MTNIVERYSEADMDTLREYYLGELDKKDAEIERLRELLKGPDPQYDMARIIGEQKTEIERQRALIGVGVHEAAAQVIVLENEIERLRAALADLRDNIYAYDAGDMLIVINTALMKP